jgi:hypothetical protein
LTVDLYFCTAFSPTFIETKTILNMQHKHGFTHTSHTH